jgi:TatD DNase family protein
MAKEYVKMGYYIGIGGVLTFKNAKKLKEVAKIIPIEKIVLETDCPYLSPEPNRGQRNDSTNIKYVVKELAGIKGISEEEIERITYENAMKMYEI